MAEEQVIYENGGVKVSNARLIMPAQTYAMSGITSVTTREFTPSKKGPIIVAIIGILLFFAKWFLGLIVVGVAVAWWVLSKSKFTLFLSSASGENEALTSSNRDFILEVEEAVNQAMIARG